MKLFQSMMKALLALMLTFGAAQANDSTFGGTGATLLPIKNTNISMMDEHIVIDGVPTSQGPMGHWKTTCTLHFKNETKEKQTITMGFPFMRTMDIVTDLPELTPAQVKALPPTERAPYLAPFIKSFTTKVRGAAVKSKEIDIKDKRSPYGHAWVWDVTFEPGETVEVVNTYEHDNSGDVEGHDWIDYILLTGKNWKDGKIGRSLLEVRPHTEFFPEVIEGIDGFDAKPGGARIVEDGAFRKVIWDLKDFAPDSDLHVSFITGKNLLKMQLQNPEILIASMDGQSCERLRQNRNAFYAWLGYPFKNADLKAYFSKKPWYQENASFDFSKLSKTNQEVLSKAAKIIGTIEKENGCR